MPLLRQRDAEQVREILADRLTGEVKITCFTQGESVLFVAGHECETCKSTRELLEEVAALVPDKLHLEVKDFLRDKAGAQETGIERIPAVVLQGAAKGRVRFYGLPAGYEFSTLIESLANVSTGAPALDDATKQAVAGITQDLHIQVFTTPTWPYCPTVASLAHKLAILNEHLTADVVEVSEFPELAQRYTIYGVPKTVINEAVQFEGAVPEAVFVQRVLEATGAGGANANANANANGAPS